MKRGLAILFVLVLMCASSALADVTVSIGNWQMDPGGTTTVPIYVSGDESLVGMTLYFQVGTNAQFASSALVPAIEGVDLLTGTIWAGESASDILVTIPPHTAEAPGIYQATVDAAATHIAGDGHNNPALLARVTLSADASLANTTFSVLMTNGVDDSTSVFTHPAVGTGGTPYPVTMVAPDGSIYVTPEPVTMSLLGFGALGLLLRRRRN